MKVRRIDWLELLRWLYDNLRTFFSFSDCEPGNFIEGRGALHDGYEQIFL
jgi:hypothetical protein